VRNVRRILVIFGAAGVVAGLAFLLWPLHAPGVTGSAATPHYRDFGWQSYSPLPDRPTAADLRRAGISLPQDLVRERRYVAVAAAVAGVAALGIAQLARRSAEEA